MNVATVKNPERRIEFPNISNLGIISYGHNNLYPQDIRSIVSCSESASTCLNRYIQFIQGNGFKDDDFSAITINKRGDTTDDLLQLVAEDLANWGGYAIHVNYNLLGDIVELNHVPYENCRLQEEDDLGYSAKIAVFPDWTCRKKRGNKTLRLLKESIDYIDRFNPTNNVVLAQIEAAGSIELYKGQILWVSSAGNQEYPKAIYDSVVTQMSTEEGLGNIAYRNVRNNFTPTTVLYVKKGLDIVNEDNNQDSSDSSSDLGSIAQAIGQAQGDLQSNKIVLLRGEYDEDVPVALNIQGANYDKDFTVTSDTACEKIYASFGQEVWHRLRKGSIGFSSDIMRDAYDVYSSITGIERRMIERSFDRIFKHWHQQLPTTDFTIKPLIYVSSASDNK